MSIEERRSGADSQMIADAVATDLNPPLFIVGIGASAGGLESLEEFFDHVSEKSNLAFVVVQHLSPDFKSMMPELLARHTHLPIQRVENEMPVRANTVYLIPPKKEMILSNGKLFLTDRDPSQPLTFPINTFFRTLAHEAGKNSAGVVLSGTGSDGSLGIREIHAAGGLILVESPESAEFDGMPLSAIDTGIVDQVLFPREMAEAVARFACRSESASERPIVDETVVEEGWNEIYSLFKQVFGIDLHHFKPTTIRRRVERRLTLNRIPDLHDYAQTLRSDIEELNAFYRELLIGPTRFFCDVEAFETIEKRIIPELVEKIPLDEEVRLWVAGCGTGEEAYSLAILVHEYLSRLKRPTTMKLFATDVHGPSLETASAGVYSPESLASVSAERLGRYFIKRGEKYFVTPELRKLVVFAPQNMLRDAPFTRLDLVSCRNLLSSLNPIVQKKILSLFHFGLKPGGVLLLGPSEAPGDLKEEFDVLNQTWKIYSKRRNVRIFADSRLTLPGEYSPSRTAWHPYSTTTKPPEQNLVRAYDSLLELFIPPGLLVNDKYELLHTFGGAGRFLSARDGRSSSSVLDNVEHEMRLVLSGALLRANKERKSVTYSGVPLRVENRDELLVLKVHPLSIKNETLPFFLITFEADGRKSESAAGAADDGIVINGNGAGSDFIKPGPESYKRIQLLEDELLFTRENLQATVEEMETTNEELQATNEELVASNEELQSTNEELHSVNEELYTVNAEHQRKIVELTELTDDIDNLLQSSEIGTIFVDRALTIRRFTPKLSDLFDILSQDIGRPLGSFKHIMNYPGLLEDVRFVMESGEIKDHDIQDTRGNWYLSRILPYRSGGEIHGAVLTFTDITGRKQTSEKLHQLSKVFMDAADPILIEDLNGTILDMNEEAERAYGWSREELIGQSVLKICPEEMHLFASELRDRCASLENIRNMESARVCKSGQVIPVLLTLSLLTDDLKRPIAIAAISKDISSLKRAERQAREEVSRRDHFLAMLSHELRNPLNAILAAANLLDRQPKGAEISRETGVLRRQSQQMTRLLDDLLDVARITYGRIHFQPQLFDLRELADDALQAIQGSLEERRHTLYRQIADEPLFVEGDRTRLLQVLENLMINAAKYTPNGGNIKLTMEGDKQSVIIRVRDNGIGIVPELLNSIFGVFVQAPQEIDRQYGGLGVGLTLARTLVELHQGSIIAESDGPGRGSEFTVTLPRAESSSCISVPVPESRRPSVPLNIVVVEDNTDNRELLREILQLDGHCVTTAGTGADGVELILKELPQVALVDLGLPVLNGFQVAQKVLERLGPGRVRLVALTGYGQDSDRKAVFEAGFDDFLVKPVSPEELSAALSAAAVMEIKQA